MLDLERELVYHYKSRRQEMTAKQMLVLRTNYTLYFEKQILQIIDFL